jgi:fucose permease
MPSSVLVVASISSALAMGMLPVLLESLRTPLQERLSLTESRFTHLAKLLILSWVPFMPIAGWLLDHWGLREALFTGSLVMALSVAWLALCQNFKGLVWALLGLGFGGACLSTAGVCLMPRALALAPHWSTGASLGLGFVFVGASTLLTPTVVAALARRFSWQRTILALGLACLLPAALVAFLSREAVAGAAANEDAGLYDLRFWLIALAAFLYFPLEHALDAWPQAYLREIGYAGRTVARLMIAFWCAFLLFRFGLAWLIRPGNETVLVLTLLVLSSMILGNLAGAYAPSSGYLGFWLVGAFYGPILPALLAILLDLEGPRHPGQAVGIVFALSALSSLVVRPSVSAFAKSHAPREAMRIPMVLALVMAAPVLLLAVMRYGG